jgi:hypothetical protein
MSEPETAVQTARRLADEECASLNINRRSFQGCVIHQRYLRSVIQTGKGVLVEQTQAQQEANLRSPSRA